MGIYRATDATLQCRLNCTDLQLLRPSTADQGQFHMVTGIMDLRTNKVYPACVKTLLHLGAQELSLFESDLRTKTDKFSDERIEILGLPLPVFYP